MIVCGLVLHRQPYSSYFCMLVYIRPGEWFFLETTKNWQHNACQKWGASYSKTGAQHLVSGRFTVSIEERKIYLIHSFLSNCRKLRAIFEAMTLLLTLCSDVNEGMWKYLNYVFLWILELCYSIRTYEMLCRVGHYELYETMNQFS